MARKFNFGIPAKYDGIINPLAGKDALVINSQFTGFDTSVWTAMTSGTPGTSTITAPNGGINAITDDVDNCYSGYRTANLFQFQTGKITYAYAKIALVEGNTDDQDAIFGFTSDVTTGGLQADGAGPLATYDGAVFYKLENATVWNAEYSDAGTQTTKTSVATRTITVATAQEFEIYFDGASTVYFYINGSQVHSATVVPANLTTMYLVFTAVASSTNAETIHCGKVVAIQEI